jgi:hypothetical protein
MPMITGSDTRMYSPRSESNLGYSKDDDDYKYGVGDPEHMEEIRDKKMAEKDKQSEISQLPHLQLSVPKPEIPQLPGLMEEEEDPLMMDDQFNEGQQFGAMTGMPDMGNLSIGNATGTMPAPGGMLATGEPMEDAWSTLMKEDEEDDEKPDPKKFTKPKKIPRVTYNPDIDINRYRRLADENVVETRETDKFPPTAYGNPDYFTTGEPMDNAWSSLIKSRLDKIKGKEQKPFSREQFEIQPGGADITTANTRRAKRTSRQMSPMKNRGLDLSPHSVDYSHLGIKTKQPLRLFPRDYDQQLGTQQKRQLLAGVPQAQSGHALGPESKYNPKPHKLSSPKGKPIKEPGEPKLRGQSLAKSAAVLREDIEALKKKVDYMKFNQIRRLLTQLKNSVERQERRLKAAKQGGHGNNREAGHMEAQNKTTKPTGGTDTIDLPDSWGAPSTMFAARGSGRVG